MEAGGFDFIRTKKVEGVRVCDKLGDEISIFQIGFVAVSVGAQKLLDGFEVFPRIEPFEGGSNGLTIAAIRKLL